jgi:hypothetical protein
MGGGGKTPSVPTYTPPAMPDNSATEALDAEAEKKRIAQEQKDAARKKAIDTSGRAASILAGETDNKTNKLLGM